MCIAKLRVFLAAFIVTTVAPTFASAQIVAIGSSAVRGVVPENQQWPALLEALLRARGSQVQVTNAGVWGDTTVGTLERIPSAVPPGTRTVILMINGFNDAYKLPDGSARAAKNVVAIKSALKARGVRIVDAMGIYLSVLRQPGMAVSDRIHLSVAGNKKVAEILARML